MLGGMKLANLVTCIVERDKSKWKLMWVADGTAPRDFSAESLTAALDGASSQTAALYANQVEAAEAELQFAIYPWKGKPGDVILDLYEVKEVFTSGGMGLVYRAQHLVLDRTDTQGSGITFTAPSFDGLVEAAERYIPDTSKAMFRWIRRVSDLA